MGQREQPHSGGRRRPSRIVIADDHPLVREALKHVLAMHPELELVGEATDGEEALELCRRLGPDLVLMDVRMPGTDGIEATRAIKAEFPRTIVLILTAMEDPEYLTEALRAGAGGYVLKGASPRQIADSIGRALAGESPLNQEVAMRLIVGMMGDEESKATEDAYPTSPNHRLAGGTSETVPAPGSSLPGALTARETEVLRQIARGQTNRQIARSLLISESTVKKHVRRIIFKLGASDRVQAVVRAIELGLLPTPSSSSSSS